MNDIVGLEVNTDEGDVITVVITLNSNHQIMIREDEDNWIKYPLNDKR